MAVSLVCPSCGAAINAADSDRGKSTLCGSCWTDVPVPAASGPVKAAPVAARPVAAAPVAAAPAVAKPAIAKPAVAMPAKAAPVSRDDDLELDLPSPRSRRRNPVDEDDEDDRPQRPEKKKGSNVLLIVGGVVALVLVLGCGGVGYVMWSAWTAAKDITEQLNKLPEDDDFGKTNPTNPFGDVFKPVTTTKSKGPFSWEKKWTPIAGDGFAVNMPEPKKPETRSDTVDGEPLKGFRYEAEEANIKYVVMYHDVPNELAFNPAQFLDKTKPLGNGNASGAKAITIGQHRGTECTRKGFAGENETVWIVKVGPRVFQFMAGYDTDWTGIHSGLEPEVRKKLLFDSIAITFNPNTPAPASVKGPKKANPKTTTPPTITPKLPTTFPPFPTPTQPSDPTTTTPPQFTPPATDEAFKAVGRVEPFLTAIVLREKQEILTFANRGPVGVMRRLSPSTYKTIAERVLPSPVTHAIADERNGRLYVATVTKEALIGIDPTNRLTATGDIQVYDLAAVLSDAPAQGDLKPLASAGLAAKIVGLELDPRGKTLYTATVLLEKAKAKTSTKTLVLKFDAANLKKTSELDVAQPLGTIRLSPDGKQLFAAEFPYNSFGLPVHGSFAAVVVHLFDTTTWKKTQTVPVPHPVTDLRFLADDKALMVMASAPRQMKLHTLDTKGVTADVTPERARHAGGYAAITPDGKTVILSGRTMPAVEVLRIEDGRIRPLGYTQVVRANPPIGGGMPIGPVILSLDGKTALFGDGGVVDFSAVGK